MQKLKRVLLFLLLACFGLGLATPALAADSSKTVYLRSQADLFALARNCSYDAYSEGLTVILVQDIDLEEQVFTPIPIFLGTFAGNNKTISGLFIETEGSEQGFFRYLAQSALVKDLVLAGVVIPTGERKNIGGIAGQNEGIIQNCRFNGVVKGKNTTGGLVGYNATPGQIIRSEFSGIAYGARKTGGIAGYNAGSILNCTNKGNINTTLEEDRLELADISTTDIRFAKVFTDATDIGGIAGANPGIIKSSRNEASVGYPQVGYNIGGIAGRQSGQIVQSENYGKVMGRKDVGGIAGQVEPHTNLVIPPSDLDQMQKEMSKLQSLLNKMLQDSRISSQGMNESMALFNKQFDKMQAGLKSLLSQTEKMLEEGMSDIEDLLAAGQEILRELEPVLSALENLLGSSGDLISSLQDGLALLLDLIEQLPQLEKELTELRDALTELIDELEKLAESQTDILARLQAVLDLVEAGNYLAAGRQLEELLAGLGQELEIIIRSARIVQDLIEKITELLEQEDDLPELAQLLTELEKSLLKLQGILADLELIISSSSQLIRQLKGLEIPDLPRPGDDYQKTKEDLFESMDELTGSLGKLLENMQKQGTLMLDNMDELNQQMFVVTNLMFDIINDLLNQELDKDNIIKDVSRDDLEQMTEGKISLSINYATVEADLNVGGVAGAMSIDLELDPEDDIQLSGKITASTIFETRAILTGCENYGTVTVKKNSAGGIVGLMDLGYIIDCVCRAEIKSTSGSYVGGIAGQAAAPINSCHARASLTGASFVGGIAGLGQEITQSYSLVAINEAKSCLGAIAGKMAADFVLSDNFFIGDSLAGVDGVSYQGQAEPLSYIELVKKRDIPDIYKDFQLIFQVDNKVIKTVDFAYGADLTLVEMPAVPARSGYYGEWAESNLHNLQFDQIIQAVYSPYLTLIESKEASGDLLPLVLVEGQFRQDDLDILEIEQGSLENSYKLTIPDDGQARHLIRFMPPDYKSNYKMQILEAGSWQKLPFKKDGKYLVFTASGTDIEFQAIQLRRPIPPVFIIIAIVVVLVLAALALFIWQQKRAPQDPAEKQG